MKIIDRSSSLKLNSIDIREYQLKLKHATSKYSDARSIYKVSKKGLIELAQT